MATKKRTSLERAIDFAYAAPIEELKQTVEAQTVILKRRLQRDDRTQEVLRRPRRARGEPASSTTEDVVPQ